MTATSKVPPPKSAASAHAFAKVLIYDGRRGLVQQHDLGEARLGCRVPEPLLGQALPFPVVRPLGTHEHHRVP